MLILIFVLLCNIKLSSQIKIVRAGLQFKPIIPFKQINGTYSNKIDNVNFSIKHYFGYSAGMVIRFDLEKKISIETGINYNKRNFIFSIDDKETGFVAERNFSFIAYEIPLSALIYIQLAKKIFMNSSFGLSIDAFPSDVKSEDEKYNQYSKRKHIFSPALIANIGFEYRTINLGFFYLGLSFHQLFSDLLLTEISYENNNKNINTRINLSGNYLTIDIRYFFPYEKD